MPYLCDKCNKEFAIREDAIKHEKNCKTKNFREAQGINGKLILGNGFIEIVRKGFMSFMTQGLKGNKKIAIKQISAIQFKPAGLMNGYIQFSFIGGIESKAGLFIATQDENTIMFKKEQQENFENIKEKIEKIIYK